MTTPPSPSEAHVPPQHRSTIPVTDPDEQHLKVLVILYYVMGGLSCLMACASVFYIVAGGLMFGFREEITADDPDVPAGLIGAVAGGVMVIGMMVAIFGVLKTVALFMTARFLALKRHRMFCIVVAAIECLSIPLGTLLGIFTIIVLTRRSVIDKFTGVISPGLITNGPPRS